MKREVLELLRVAGVREALSWRDVIVLFNYAPVPPPPVYSKAPWNRGFNFVVVVNGTPKYFVKCRPKDDEVLAWDTAIRRCLASGPVGGLWVADVSVASSELLTLQVSPFLNGPHYGRLAPAQSEADYLAAMRTVLEGTAGFADRAVAELPRAGQPAAPTTLAVRAEELTTSATVLAHLGPGESRALNGAFARPGSVPSRPQHGDLWWQNLIVADGRLWLIDFDAYGEIRIPLFDDMTIVLTTLGLRAGSAVAGVDRLISENSEGRACRALLLERAAAEGVADSQLNQIFLYYLVGMAATVNRRGGPVYAAPHIEALRHAVTKLAEGHRLLESKLG